MRFQLLNTICLLVLIVGSQCQVSELIQTLNKVRESQSIVNIQNSDFYLNTIQLSIESGENVQDVVFLINDLIKDLNKQIEDATTAYTAKNIEFNSDIKKYKGIIVSLKKSIKNLEQQISSTKSLISTQNRKIKINKEQHDLANSKQIELQKARTLDVENYNTRTTRQQNMLKAINYLIDELQKALKTESFLQVKQVLKKHAELTEFNQMQAFLDVTMTFSKKAVENCIKQLSTIKVSLSESLVDEAKNEKKAKQNFEKLNNEIKEFINGVSKEEKVLKEKLTELQGKLAQLKIDLSADKFLLSQNKKILKQTQEEQIKYNKQYEIDQKQRKSEVSVCDQVIEILQKSKSIKQVEKYSFAMYSL